MNTNLINESNKYSISFSTLSEKDRVVILKDALSFLDKRIKKCNQKLASLMEITLNNFYTITTINGRVVSYQEIGELVKSLRTLFSNEKVTPQNEASLNNQVYQVLKKIQDLANEWLAPELTENFEELAALSKSENLFIASSSFFMGKVNKIRTIDALIEKTKSVTDKLLQEENETVLQIENYKKETEDAETKLCFTTCLYMEQSDLISQEISNIASSVMQSVRSSEKFHLFSSQNSNYLLVARTLFKLALDFWTAEQKKYGNPECATFDLVKFGISMTESSKAGEALDTLTQAALRSLNLQVAQLLAAPQGAEAHTAEATESDDSEDLPELPDGFAPEEPELESALSGVVTAHASFAAKHIPTKVIEMVGSLPVKGVTEYKNSGEIKLTRKYKRSGFSKYVGDLSKDNPITQARTHMEKRILFFQSLCRFVESHRIDFFGCTFPTTETDQYTAMKYFTTNQNTSGEYQNAHISLIPKLAIMNTKGLWRIGKTNIVMPGKDPNQRLNQILNACDFAPKSINRIDALCEYVFRPFANRMFTDIVAGQTASVASASVSVELKQFLNDLKASIKDINILNPWYNPLSKEAKKQFDKKYNELLNDEDCSKYIDGMIAAL